MQGGTVSTTKRQRRHSYLLYKYFTFHHLAFVSNSFFKIRKNHLIFVSNYFRKITKTHHISHVPLTISSSQELTLKVPSMYMWDEFFMMKRAVLEKNTVMSRVGSLSTRPWYLIKTLLIQILPLSFAPFKLKVLN
jgi:hypothetical protein